MASDVHWSFSQKYGVRFPLVMSWNPQLFQYKCSEKKRKGKWKKSFYKSFLSAGVANWCTFMFLPPAKKKSKSPSMWFWLKKAKVREDGREVWKFLSVLSSGCPDAGLRNTFPICALLLTRVESRREGAREQDREGESVTVEWDSVNQSGRQAGGIYWSKGSGSKQAQLPLPGLITRGCVVPNPSLQLVISLSHWCILGNTDRIVHWVEPPTYKKQVYVAVCSDEGGEWAGWGGVAAVQRWVGRWRGGKGREWRNEKGGNRGYALYSP